jgi:hypothetical protein
MQQKLHKNKRRKNLEKHTDRTLIIEKKIKITVNNQLLTERRFLYKYGITEKFPSDLF